MQNSSASKSRLFGFIILILAVLAAGIWLIFRFASSQAEQDLDEWKTRLGLIADSRAASVSTWLNRHLRVVEELASDASVQLYVAQASLPDHADIADGQRGYVFSLLSSEAERSGFHEQRAIDTVAANVKRPRRAGLAIVNGEGIASVMTTGMPLLRPDEINFGDAASFIAVGPMLADKTPLVVFGARITPSVSAEASPGSWLIGARPLDGDFLATLEQPGDQSATAETYLVVRGAEDIVTPLTPLKGGGRTGEARKDTAAYQAALHPGGFAILPNYSNQEVLVVGKELSAPVSWVLVRTISAKEALTEITARRNNLILTLSLAALFVLAGLILAWRHGVSQKLASSYREQEKLLTENQSLSAFLQSVSDNLPAAIAAVDDDMTVRFANTEMTSITGIDRDDLMNRRLDTAFAGDIADQLRSNVTATSTGNSAEMKITLNDPSPATYHTNILPLEAGGNTDASALVVMRDITELLDAQEQSETLYRQLISTLTEIIDARDPWSKHHSGRVADVAGAIAEEMGLEDSQCEAARIAGQLVNIGKIFVPPEILTKQTPLTDDELALVRDSMKKVSQLIANLNFRGPVASTLEQMRANWDGSGEPEGLKGEDIEPGARVLSVANAFVGMVSARAHRDGFDFDKTARILQEDAGKRYDRKVVAALNYILENKDGRSRWVHYMNKPE